LVGSLRGQEAIQLIVTKLREMCSDGGQQQERNKTGANIPLQVLSSILQGERAVVILAHVGGLMIVVRGPF
jgi:hypothetical protein